MKPSAMQESGGYGADVSGNRLSDGVDKTKIGVTNDAYSEDNSNIREESSMISNLPLLFANGHPTSLEKITMVQLERFISFMVHCSLGHDTTKIINQPQWWPQDVKFSNPLTRPKKINDNWMANLKKLVFRCYTYHRSEYLLRFCSYLARYPHEELQYVNNWDSTTSLYHKSTGKLLVTFRNENMNYDKKNESSRRTLLSHNATSPGYGNKVKQQNTPMMVQPPCDDIYLCDNCDAEFVGLTKMKEHEKICGEQENGGSGSRSSTPDLSVVEPERQQHQFLEYFNLRSIETEAKPPDVINTAETDNGIVKRTSRRVRGSLNFARCASIPFSSPAGLVLAKKSKIMTQETQQERLDRIERHVIAPVLNSTCRPKWLDAEPDYDRWVVTYKPSRDKPNDDYVHQYRFVNSSKYKPALSIEAQLLYAACQPIYVVLTRLSEKQIEKLQQDPSQYQPPNLAREVKLTRRKAGPACKTKSRPVANAQNASLSAKRKASLGNESDPIVVEDDEVSASLTVSTRGALTASTDVRSPSAFKTEDLTKPVREKKSCPTSSIMLIDLCSSDEEEDRRTLTPTCDENRDPMSSTEPSITRSFLRKVTSTKHYAKPHPVPSPTDRLSSNVLNEDRKENCTNKSRTGVLNEYAHLSPVLRSAP
ncbi:PREDICTED: uncharacterized protein LOC106742336 [Dinoponera quadriceps]|uniref:Uncharacterized protein LOC106742336 n=1 Tax=Dinoponera quadriceps TaxID=609295 RepID=A0A6P3WX39_DINQU|nr:PREDICTED: uncharacterized protein LOC106742336 [Dinoponera quadriceps]XP_014470686.1 PREDICTED: uncharacterized protein LOC106742336 [Dinoponera quadriceps]XP_014470693.1 PREDICTED: uncharacterized protein LOC106742336 [Dinoponera quadriceps]XP_014470702.1 PREDICTED: uncharacterized protein LOC106742336 [Dinoponera quadriceps]XP_014470710.1 PREDICTED: uncharacterized protein LOC106742336 [Dinoponera quadriceps]XP_014470720.1 PREDICTED: uncharacterized protein LOC106742336 [Dinoponera quadr